MNVSDASTLYRYNDWANGLIFNAIAALPHDDIDRDLGGSLSNLRSVAAHVISTEWAWLERWLGVSPKERSGWMSGDITSLMARLLDIQAKRSLFLDKVSDEALASPMAFTYLSGNADEQLLQDMLVHVMNHSTYHRGQITLMFRQLGHAPPATDFVLFRSETR